jgi:ubiquinone/menaquinone biosynthesis C-methylase UbiE
MTKTTHYYNPQFFDAPDLKTAADIILFHDSESTQSRWNRETEFLVQLWKEKGFISKNSSGVDFGCGVGRLSRRIIESFEATVIGVDISASMLKFSFDYVASGSFVPMPRSALDRLDLKVDFIVCSWTLQHCPAIQEEIALLKRLLKPGGKLFCLNTYERCIPIEGNPQWLNDGFDILNSLQENFYELELGKLPEDVTSKVIRDISWWGIFTTKDNR